MEQLTFFCPYLRCRVELTNEREQHIIATHPGTLPDYLAQLRETIADPDLIRQSERDENALLFSKWFDTIRTGRYLVCVVITDLEPKRCWIVTVYTSRKLVGGKTIWQKS